MPGSSFGRIFKVTTFGESHGRAIGVIIDGVPAFLELAEEDVQKELNRRRPGQSKVSTPRNEADQVEIVSGVFDGRTMGPPVAMIIRNKDQNPGAYTEIKEKFRPGHADFTYLAKYGIRDWRGSGRASGRETACRVAAGAVAKKILAARGIRIVAFAREIDGVRAGTVDYSVIEENIVRTADPSVAEAMVARIDAARNDNDSVGGIIEVHVHGVPAGIGDPVFDKLEALLGHAFLSVGAVKGVEFGDGFDCSRMRGSAFNDAFEMKDEKVQTRTNHCGGIIGGISTGGTIIARLAVRPPASISLRQDTINIDLENTPIEVHGRHDPCIVPRAVPVIEAMAALTIVDALLLQDAYKGMQCSHDEAAAFLKRDWPG